MERRPAKLKKSYSSLLRHANKRAKGERDDDTDSVASDASSISRPMKKHAAPLNRRRSLRIQHLQQQNVGAMLLGQNTVQMSDPPAPRRLQRMATSQRWTGHRNTTVSKLQQQDTIAPPGTLRQGATKRGREEDIEEEEDGAEDNVNGGNRLLRKQTTAGLTGMMAGARLETMVVPSIKHVQQRQEAECNTAPSGGQRRTVSNRVKRTSTVIQSPSTTQPPKRQARTGILMRRKKTTFSADTLPPSSEKHNLEDCEKVDGDPKRQRRMGRKQASVTAEVGSVYFPPKNQWPLNIFAPVVWSVPLRRADGSTKHALAVHVDPTCCMLGDEDGTVVKLDASVSPVLQYQLPSGVKCLLPDGDVVYAGCNDSGLYDISHQQPRLIWQAKGFGQLYQLDTFHGQVAISDEHGNVGLIAYDGAFLWKQKSAGAFGWMVCVDDTGVYHGHASGVTKYSLLDGTQMWHCDTEAPVMAGTKDDNHLYAAVGSGVITIDKYTGNSFQTYQKGKSATGVLHCCAIGGGMVYAGGNKLVCYDALTGEVVHILQTKQRWESLHYFQARLFCLGAGALHVVDLTQASIMLAQHGKGLDTVEVNPNPSTPTITPLKRVDTVSRRQGEQEVAAGNAVMLECYSEAPKARHGRLKVRALSKGFSSKLDIQFPAELYRAGAHYVVQNLNLSEGATFYRVGGTIQEVKEEK